MPGIPPRVSELAKWVITSAESLLPGESNFEARIRVMAGVLASMVSTGPDGRALQPTPEEKNLAAHLVFGLTEKQGGVTYHPAECVAALCGALDGTAILGVDPVP